MNGRCRSCSTCSARWPGAGRSAGRAREAARRRRNGCVGPHAATGEEREEPQDLGLVRPAPYSQISNASACWTFAPASGRSTSRARANRRVDPSARCFASICRARCVLRDWSSRPRAMPATRRPGRRGRRACRSSSRRVVDRDRHVGVNGFGFWKPSSTYMNTGSGAATACRARRLHGHHVGRVCTGCRVPWSGW